MALTLHEKKTTLHPLVAHLLERRGITDEEERDRFLNPDYDRDRHDPFLLADMEKAVSRLLTAIAEDEKIIIYTDYDTDGIPAGVIFHDFFKKIGFSNFENYIPHRHKEGYGINKEALTQFARDGVSLIITADCGITDNKEAEYAQSLGMDIIITDHHLPGETLPPAYAVINPKRTDDSYPFPDLCGCAVAFKLIEATIQKGNKEGYFSIPQGWEKWLLDMVGIATISDMVPLHGENRVLAHYGLKVLRRSSRPGLVHLFRKLRIPQQHIIEDDVGFAVGPRINAASRMDTPRHAFVMLSTDDEIEAGEVVAYLEKLNTRRKGVVAGILKEARRRIKEREAREVIVLGNPNWQPGLLGLAANNLAEDFGKSVFLWGRGEEGETIKGSCRSDGSVSIVECMDKAQDAFLDFGGHRNSGGFSVSDDKIHTLEEELIAAWQEIEKEEKEEGGVVVDGELSPSLVTWDMYTQIDVLAPFGMGNPRPIFLFEKCEIAEVRWFGKQKNHLEFFIIDEKGSRVPVIAFFAEREPLYQEVKQGMNITFKGTLEKNIFMGKISLRVRIHEIDSLHKSI